MQSPRFLTRVFSDAENILFQSRGFSAQTVAVNFCAKEAFSKAIGTGIRGFSLNEVSALRDELGKPYLQLSGKAKEIAEEKRLVFDVSLTHTGEYAAAVVIAYTED